MATDVNMVAPKVGLNDQLALLQAGLANAKVKLCKAAPPTGPGTVIADLTAIEADYTGYAAKTITAFTGPFDLVTGEAAILGSLAAFSPSGTAVGNNIFGGWVETATGTLEFVFVLPAPVALDGPTDVLPLVVEPRNPGPGVVHVLD